MGRSRAGRSLTEFDGNLSSVAENARFALNLGSYPGIAHQPRNLGCLSLPLLPWARTEFERPG